jgi:hypothetical protein
MLDLCWHLFSLIRKVTLPKLGVAGFCTSFEAKKQAISFLEVWNLGKAEDQRGEITGNHAFDTAVLGFEGITAT